MNHVYGPVPSRRLGHSLGIDPIPFKTCNWNCVYCQLGRTSPLVSQRSEYVPTADIMEEVAETLSTHAPGEIDWVTFAGSGEPTLHSGLGEMIRGLKALTDIPIAVITNGSLLYLPEVRSALQAADAVMPSLDAGSEALYQKINRPIPQLNFQLFVEGLLAFGREYEGELWVEVMLIKGMNDSEEELQHLANVLSRVSPDEVHINLPVRPPCEPWVQPADDDALARAVAIFGTVARVMRPLDGTFGLSGSEDIVDAILDVIMRHPMSEEELVQTLGSWQQGQITNALAELERSGQAQIVSRGAQRFWSYAGARYVDQKLSRCHSEQK